METRPENRQRARAAGDGTKKLGKRIERVGHTAEQVWDRTRDSFSDFSNALDIKGRVERHPYGTVAAALGIGYVLGGGLFTPLTARIVGMGMRIGLRLAVLPLLKQEMAELVENDRGRRQGQGQRGRGKRTRSEQGEMSHEPEGTAQFRQGRHSGNDGAADEELDRRRGGRDDRHLRGGPAASAPASAC